ARLAHSKNGELAFWVIAKLGSLGGEVAAETLAPVASSSDRARAAAAAQALAVLPEGEKLLAQALCKAQDEVGAQVLSEALMPLAKKLGKKEQNALFKAGQSVLKDSFGLGRRKLDPIRDTDPEGWGEALREAAQALGKKEPSRAEAIYGILCRSTQAT